MGWGAWPQPGQGAGRLADLGEITLRDSQRPLEPAGLLAIGWQGSSGWFGQVAVDTGDSPGSCWALASHHRAVA